MTFREWLDSKENSYVECEFIDADGNPQYFWTEDDLKYKANVVRVLPNEEVDIAIVVTDYKERSDYERY